MAATLRDLKMALSMKVDQFFAAAAAVSQESGKLKEEVEKPLKMKIGNEIKTGLKDVKNEAKKTEKDIEKSPIDFNVRFQGAFRKAWEEYDGTRKRIRKNPIRVNAVGIDDILQKLAAVGIAFAGLSQSFTFFREFETSLANVASLGVENIDALKNQVIEIGIETPVALNDLTTGLYNVVSAGVDSANQISVLESSAKAAKAGLAETSDALNLGSAVIKGYGKNFSEFEGVMDKAFQTVKLGQTTFPELAAAAGKVIPNFAALKIDTTELFGAFATLTGVTGSTAEVSTQLKAITEGLLKPTKELNALIKNQTGLSAEQFTAQEGLAGVLKIVKEATKGSATEAGKLFSSSEALAAVLSLTSAQFDEFAKKSGAMASATGAANAAFEVQAKTLDSQLQILENRFNVVTESILSGVVPAVTGLVDIVASALESFARLDETTQKTILTLAALSAILIKAPAIIKAVRVAVIGLRASLGGINGIIALVGAAAGAVAIFTDNSEEAARANKRLTESNQALADSFKKVKAAATGKFGKQETGELLELQRQLTAELEIEKARLGDINKVLASNNEQRTIESTLREKARQQVTGKEVVEEKTKERAKTIIRINEANARLTAIRQVLETRQEDERKLTATQLKEQDERKKFEFETNRITLTDYVKYLQTRRGALRDSLGAESIEFLKFTDELNQLSSKLATEQATKTLKLNVEQSGDLEAREIENEASPRIIEVETKFSETSLENLEREYTQRNLIISENLNFIKTTYGEDTDAYQTAINQKMQLDRNYNESKNTLNRQLVEVDTQLSETGLINLQAEYETRTLLLDTNMLKIQEIYGADTEAYRAALNKKLALDKSYNTARNALNEAGFKTALGLGDQLVSAFQGQSKTMFNIGKALSIANTTVNAIEAVSRSFKDYPWPFNIAVAAIQGGLAFAQVQKIRSTKFNPPKGKAEGGLITGADFLASALPVPRGEDGYIAVQRGEMVVNRRATQAFFPVLNKLNKAYAGGGVTNAPIPAFRQGGRVDKVAVPFVQQEQAQISPQDISVAVEDGVSRALGYARIHITGNFKAEGKDLTSAIDKQAELTSEL